MKGVITSKDVLANLGLIWWEFGTACFLRCVASLIRGESTTFLEVALRER
jgi:hypothetical protein